MTKFNKRVLAMAIAGAIMLPGAASAADLEFGSSQQITFAKDLIVNNGTTIYTPNDLDLRAAAIDAANMATVTAGETVRVKVTLTNGAKFDTTADALTLVQGFVVGTELQVAATTIGVNGGGGPEIVGTPYYSTSGQELNFEFTVDDTGADLVSPAYAVKMNSFQITNLKDASDAGQTISAEVTMQNSDGQQILAAREVIADFAWGITSFDLDSGYDDYRIDVGGCASGTRTRFSVDGDVGDCDATIFNAGGLTLDITEAEETDGATDSYINNFSAVAAIPYFNVVNTATWTFTVDGEDLAAFTGGDLYLSNSAVCNAADPSNVSLGTIATGAASKSVDVAAGSALVAGLSAASPSPEDIYVCFRGDDTSKMLPQDLSVSWSIDYDLPTQRVNPPGDEHDILPLLLNGTTITFQNVNPAGNATAQSFLRITNHNDFDCPITIDAKDDEGTFTEDSGDVVEYVMPAQASKQFNSDVLENGSDDTTGSFGDGVGKWYVRVTAECANVMGSALNRNSNDGTVTNLTAERGEHDEDRSFGR